MNRGLSSRIVTMLQTVAACLLAAALVNGQAAPQEKPLMADDVFKNIQVLRGLTVDQFMGTMGFIAAALSMNCSECHHTGSAAEYADDTPRKQTARKMILMVNALNKANFGGKREVTCYSCHRSDSRPKVTPSLAEQYGTPPPDDPNELEFLGRGPRLIRFWTNTFKPLGARSGSRASSASPAKELTRVLIPKEISSPWRSMPRLRMSARPSFIFAQEITSGPATAEMLGTHRREHFCQYPCFR